MTEHPGGAASMSIERGDRAELILNQLGTLPTIPAVAVKLLEVTTSSESDAQDVVRIIESDAALTAAVLKMVKRADLGLSAEVSTVQRAIVLLGFTAVRNAVLSLQLYETFGPSDADCPTPFVRTAFWKHSLAVACTAQHIAQKCRAIDDPGEAFVGGLLHDIGKLSLDAAIPKTYARVVRQVQQERACISDVENRVLGFDHTVAGKRMAANWGLPSRITECIWLHHQSPESLPSSVQAAPLVRIIHLADNLVRREVIGFSGYRHVAPVAELASALGINPEILSTIGDDIPALMKPYGELVGLNDEEDSPSIQPQVLIEANRQLGRSNRNLIEKQRLLEVRSACFDAMRGFTRELVGHNDSAGVARAASEAVRRAVDCTYAGAFIFFPQLGCIQISGSGSSNDEGSGRLVDLSDSIQLALTEALAGIPAGVGLVAAPAPCLQIWRHMSGGISEGSPWLWPIVENNSTVGGVLFCAGDDTVKRFLSARPECEALSVSMGLAVASARAQRDSDRMNEELLDVNRRLGEAQRDLVRMRSISMVAEMAAGAAHEINNPLAVVSGRAQMLREMADDEEACELLDIISDHTLRASRIVDDLMSFAKPRPPKPCSQQIGRVLQGLCQHWKHSSSLSDNNLILEVSDPATTVYVDPAQLEEILDAVMTNAVEATKPESARLQINSSALGSDDKVRIVVEDNGVGMSADVLEHAFDPFYSERPAGRGRGLGLSRAYRYAEMNGGRILLESKSGVGTTVTIELPSRAPQS